MTLRFALRVYGKEYNIRNEPFAGNTGNDLFEFMQRKGQ
jgi:hypothetical protein